LTDKKLPSRANNSEDLQKKEAACASLPPELVVIVVILELSPEPEVGFCHAAMSFLSLNSNYLTTCGRGHALLRHDLNFHLTRAYCHYRRIHDCHRCFGRHRDRIL
jgi:hypothetical protein